MGRKNWLQKELAGDQPSATAPFSLWVGGVAAGGGCLHGAFRGETANYGKLLGGTVSPGLQ